MFLAALFEELLFRDIIQNLLYVFTDKQWIAISITTILFIGIHGQYFKKPLMLLNISVPSLIFGWLYVETSNIVVPLAAHFVMNMGITLLFKYEFLQLKK